mgnify:CR=1 FL=1
MKLNPHFKLRSIAGETIIVNQGVPDTDLTRIILETTFGKGFHFTRGSLGVGGILSYFSRAGRKRCGDLGRCTKKMFSLT